MNDSSSGGLRRTTVNVKHRSTRLSSSFKEDINVEQQQQQRSGFLTRNLIRMFKSGGRSHSSFSDDDEPTNNGKKRTGNTDKLSRKFLNMILTTANRNSSSSSNNKCSKSATDDLKIPISKTHSFKPIQVDRDISFMIYDLYLIFGLFF
jgi:hypothetical protein